MKVIMYTKNACGWCVKAKQLLDASNVNDVTVKVIGENGVTVPELQEYMDKVNPSNGPITTVPQIFIDGKHIGGYTELEAFMR